MNNIENIVKQSLFLLCYVSIGFAQSDTGLGTIISFHGKTKSELFNSIVNWAILNNYEEKDVLPKSYEGLTGFALAEALNDEERKRLIEIKDYDAGIIVLKGSAKLTHRWLIYTIAISIKNEKIKIEYPNNISKAPIIEVKNYLNALSNKITTHITNDNW